ncbi:MAG TPA: hypothetical protein VKA60_01330 [Blastocatellia bacterium]|nr:hypothetical protein [Blastocatellia bacterium]
MSDKVRRIVATYEIIIGLVAFVAAAMSLADIGWLQITIAVIGGATSLIAGVSLWQARSFSRSLSLFVQALQVPRISIGGVVLYGIHLGAAITPGAGLPPPPFQQAVYSYMRFGSQASGLYVGVNILALAALILVAMRKRESPANSNRLVAAA